ncbi:MAG: hypothetical protein HY843_06090 [Bdellovibrio sp.]|nr:hypothetical protein [Bdellovibrio sp.]
MAKKRKFLLVFFILLCFTSCMTAYRKTVGADINQIFTKLYFTDFNTAWQGALEALKSSRMDVSNREGGFIQTRWTDNTQEKNFIDSFGDANAYLSAKYRFRVTVAKGFFNGVAAIKVSVQKDQITQRDVLEGWRHIETDSIEENTLLYRIGRIIYIKMKLAQIEEEKVKKALEETQFEEKEENEVIEN